MVAFDILEARWWSVLVLLITLPPSNNIGDVDKIATANALAAVAANSSLSNMVDITQTLNAPVTINGDDDKYNFNNWD